MKAMDELEEVLGYAPSDELRRIILRHAKEKNIPVLEAADAYAMPPQFIVGRGNTFQYNGETMTSVEFQRRFPYRRFVIVRTRE